jgi:hypothetical protein
MRSTKAPPTCGSSSMVRPKKYRCVKSGEVSACHTCSGVAAM